MQIIIFLLLIAGSMYSLYKAKTEEISNVLWLAMYLICTVGYIIVSSHI